MFADANRGKAVFEIQRLGGGIAGADFQQQARDTGGLGVAEPMFQKCGGTDQGEGLPTASIAARAGQSSEKAGRIFMPALSVLPALWRSGRLCCGHKAIRHARHRTRDNAR